MKKQILFFVSLLSLNLYSNSTEDDFWSEFEEQEPSAVIQNISKGIEFAIEAGIVQAIVPELFFSETYSEAGINVAEKGLYNASNMLLERSVISGMTRLVHGDSIPVLPNNTKLFLNESLNKIKGQPQSQSGYAEILPTLAGKENYERCLKEYKSIIRIFYAQYIKKNNLEIDAYSILKEFDAYNPKNPNFYFPYMSSQLRIMESLLGKTINLKQFKFALLKHLVKNQKTFQDIIRPYIKKKDLAPILLSAAIAGLAFNYGTMEGMKEAFPHTQNENIAHAYMKNIITSILSENKNHQEAFLDGSYKNKAELLVIKPGLIKKTFKTVSTLKLDGSQEATQDITSITNDPYLKNKLDRFHNLIDENHDQLFNNINMWEQEITDLKEREKTPEVKVLLKNARKNLKEAKNNRLVVVESLNNLCQHKTAFDTYLPTALSKAINSLQNNTPMKWSALNKFLPMSDNSSGTYIWKNLLNINEYTALGVKNSVNAAISAYFLKSSIDVSFQLCKNFKWEEDEGIMLYMGKFIFISYLLNIIGTHFVTPTFMSLYDSLENLYIQYKFDQKLSSARGHAISIKEWLESKFANSEPTTQT